MENKNLWELIKERFKLSSKTGVYLIIASAAVILLIMLNSFSSGVDGSSDNVMSQHEISMIDREYEERIKTELEEVISKIKGVGDVTVMVTTSGSTRMVYAKDVQKDELEQRTENVIVGNKEALVESVSYPQIEGVLVVCSGGESAEVKEKVINAVSTVLNISSNRVYVTNSVKER